MVEGPIKRGKRGAKALRRGFEFFTGERRSVTSEGRYLDVEMFGEPIDEAAFIRPWTGTKGVEPEADRAARMQRDRHQAGVETA